MKTKEKILIFKRTITLVTLWIFLCSDVSLALRPQSAKDRILAVAPNAETIDGKHAYFAQLQKEAERSPKKASVELQFLEADGRLGTETVILPADKVSGNMDLLIDYLATLVNVRGLMNGAVKIAVLTKEIDAEDVMARLQQCLKSNYGNTEFMMSFGKSTQFTTEPLKAELQVARTAPISITVDYNQGVGVGFDLGGQGIKWAQRTQPGQKPATGRVKMGDLTQLGALAGFIKGKIQEIENATGQKIDAAHPVIVTIPGPITPDGHIVLITNLEETRPGTKKELEDL